MLVKVIEQYQKCGIIVQILVEKSSFPILAATDENVLQLTEVRLNKGHCKIVELEEWS